MQIPNFTENNHPHVKSLSHYSDRELLTLFQRHPEQGKFFTAIFCRYSPIVYTLIAHSGRSPVQVDYLFALTWRHIYYAMTELDLRGNAVPGMENFNLQNWLINITALCINQAEVPPVESIHYSLEVAPPPLWCYTHQALDFLPPLQRLIVLMSETFHWSEARISAYLQTEGETLSPNEVKSLLDNGLKELQQALPVDIREIYDIRGTSVLRQEESYL